MALVLLHSAAGLAVDVHDPETSLELATKNALLLEDHLAIEGLFCRECIAKHWLAVEAYLAEAISLDKGRRFSDLVELATWANNRRRAFEAGDLASLDAASAVRDVRKAIEYLRRGAAATGGQTA